MRKRTQSRLNVDITDDMKARIKRVSDERGQTYSVFVRRALLHALETPPPPRSSRPKPSKHDHRVSASA